jgi:KDO2-lipid IV(A) lauroyltransferase
MNHPEAKRLHLANINTGLSAKVIHRVVLFYIWVSSLVPITIWVYIGKCFGSLLYILARRHRNISLINMKFAFGDEKKESEMRDLTKRNFQHLAMMGHEWLTLRNISEKELLSRIEVEGKEHLLTAKKKSPSVILLGAHFGNWEYAHLYYAHTIGPLNFIVRKVDNPYIEEERVKYNTKFGVNILDKENGLRPAIKRLKKGEDLVLFPDQTASFEGIPVKFFGKKTNTLHLPVSLAMKYSIPIVPMFIVRQKDRRSHRLIFLPEIEIKDKTAQNALETYTQQQNDVIEKMIREYPDHWLWIHRKWKCYHPEIYEQST